MIKSRSEIVTITGSQDSWVRSSGSYTPRNYSSTLYGWKQITNTHDSQFHRVQRMRYNGEKNHDRSVRFLKSRDWGNNFRTEKVRIESSLNEVHLSGKYLLYDYRVDQYGPVLFSDANSVPAFNTQDEADLLTAELLGLGTTAIARSHPGQPGANLLVSIGELAKDGIPSIIGSMAGRARTIREISRAGGSEYLNLQFGWVPLVKDVIALAQVAANTRRIVEQFERDIDRDIRRRYQFPPKIESSVGLTKAYNYYYPVSNTPVGGVTQTYVKLSQTPGTAADVVEINKTTTKSWFSGKFRWFFPDVAEGLEYFTEIERKANVLLGTRLDPEVLWNLQPWTWLIDWFLNSGSFFHNVSAFGIDGLVMPYGYLMQEVERDRQVTFPGLFARDNSGVFKNTSGPFTVTQNYSRKARVKATPYGFGLNPDLDFSPTQWTILGALGLSQGLR